MGADGGAGEGGKVGGVDDVAGGGKGGVFFAGAVAAFAADAGFEEGLGGRSGLEAAGVALEARGFDEAGEFEVGAVFVAGGDVPFLGFGVVGEGGLEELVGFAEEVAATDVAGAEEPFELAGGGGELEFEGGGDGGVGGGGVGEGFFGVGGGGTAGGLGHAGGGVLAGDGGVAAGAGGVTGFGEGGEGDGEEKKKTGCHRIFILI